MTYQGKVSFTATIKARTSPVAGSLVTLQRRLPGHGWTTVATVTTNGNGVAAKTLKATATAFYRVVTSTAPAVASGSVKVSVRSAVTYHLSATHATRSSRITVIGSASPQVAGARVAVQRKVGSKWIRLPTLSSRRRTVTAQAFC